MKSRLKLQRALEAGTLTKEEQEFVEQFPHIYKLPESVGKTTASTKSSSKRRKSNASI